MITIENLNVSYDKKHTVLNSLSLILESNKIHGIVGLNGAGKTTLLNSVYGLIKPDEGRILIDDIKSNKKLIGYLETENYFYSNVTGTEHLNIFKNTRFDTDLWNALFKLPLNDLIETYSTGMKKKLAVLTLLKQDKPVMILDEPFNGLDIETAMVLRSILLNLKEKKTIIITSHIIETLTNLCDDISYLESGKVKFTKLSSDFEAFEQEIYADIEERNQQLITELLIKR
jgi:ABC-2 type transport system ATP-binding protein